MDNLSYDKLKRLVENIENKFANKQSVQKDIDEMKQILEELSTTEYYVSDDWTFEIKKRNKITKEDIID